MTSCEILQELDRVFQFCVCLTVLKVLLVLVITNKSSRLKTVVVFKDSLVYNLHINTNLSKITFLEDLQCRCSDGIISYSMCMPVYVF